jgi:signal transduction histidine kinase
MNAADPDRSNGSEWHWLWDVYIIGGCLAAMAAVVLLDDRLPGNEPVALAALTGIVAWLLTVGRRVLRSDEFTWRCVVFVGVAVALCIVALWAAPAAVAAIPAIYPLIFASLPLPTALVVTTAVNLAPLIIALAVHGPRWPNMPLTIAITLVGVVAGPVIGTVIITSMRQRDKLARLVAELEASRAESARLSREAGASAERDRLSREIHDTLAQGFTSIVALTHAVEPELDADPPAARNHLELIRATARENLAEARVMVAGLTPAAAVRRQGERLMAEMGITVTVDTDPNLPALGMAADVVLLRCAQEAFANVRKHSGATAVRVTLCADDDCVRLTIVDNGAGLPDDHADGFGLRGMRARLAEAGGTMSVSRVREGGVMIEVEVPT